MFYVSFSVVWFVCKTVYVAAVHVSDVSNIVAECHRFQTLKVMIDIYRTESYCALILFLTQACTLQQSVTAEASTV